MIEIVTTWQATLIQTIPKTFNDIWCLGLYREKCRKTIPIFQNKVLWCILNAIYCIRNDNIHKDLKIVSAKFGDLPRSMKNNCIITRMLRCYTFLIILNLCDNWTEWSHLSQLSLIKSWETHIKVTFNSWEIYIKSRYLLITIVPSQRNKHLLQKLSTCDNHLFLTVIFPLLLVHPLLHFFSKFWSLPVSATLRVLIQSQSYTNKNLQCMI